MFNSVLSIKVWHMLTRNAELNGPQEEGNFDQRLPVLSRRSLLLVIDVQKGFDDPVWGSRSNPFAERNISLLLAHWRKFGLPIIFFKHNSKNPLSPLYPRNPGNSIKAEVAPKEGEIVMEKNVNSCFIGTPLNEWLISNGIDTIFMVGLTAEHCVSTTARMSGNMGYRTIVVQDATASFESHDLNGMAIPPDTVHEISLATIRGEFAQILKTAEVLLSPMDI
ncbi:MAG: cysteine hydrolase family protein [Thermoplasmataceae archaeon]